MEEAEGEEELEEEGEGKGVETNLFCVSLENLFTNLFQLFLCPDLLQTKPLHYLHDTGTPSATPPQRSKVMPTHLYSIPLVTISHPTKDLGTGNSQ